MEKIILEVDDNVAKAWRTASVKLKEVGSLIIKRLQQSSKKKKKKILFNS